MFNSILNIGVFVSFRVEQLVVGTFKPPWSSRALFSGPAHPHLHTNTRWDTDSYCMRAPARFLTVVRAFKQHGSADSNSHACIGSHEQLGHPVHNGGNTRGGV